MKGSHLASTVQQRAGSQTPVEQRLSGLLDCTKGIAILAVVVYHVTKKWFGWQGVHTFIVLSGFGLTLSLLKRPAPPRWDEWFRRRAFRILPAYWAAAAGGFLLFICGEWIAGQLSASRIESDAVQLIMDVTLLRNFSYSRVFAEPNASLWFIPLLAGLYAVFPVWFTWMSKRGTAIGLAGAVAAAFAIEIAYRAASVFLLDGSPVGYGAGFFGPIGRPMQEALDRLPGAFPFRETAPFGFFASRLGEFVLGMASAAVLTRYPAAFERAVFSIGGVLWGTAAWLAGIVCMAAARWTWAVADILIAAGFTLVLIRFSEVLSRRAHRLFRALAGAGRSGYYLFLAHMPPLVVFAHTYPLWSRSIPLAIAALALTLAAMWAATLALGRFDRWISR